MPFKSKAQERYFFAKKPEMAKEFAAKTPNMASLPGKVGGSSSGFASAIAAQKNKGMLK